MKHMTQRFQLVLIFWFWKLASHLWWPMRYNPSNWPLLDTFLWVIFFSSVIHCHLRTWELCSKFESKLLVQFPCKNNYFFIVDSKLMLIVFSNREWPFLRLFNSSRIPTNTLIARYMISVIGDARCIDADL